MASTEAQKKANRTYREKHKPVQITIQYKSDKNEGLRLKQYLSDNNITANQYVKMLIKRDLDEKGIAYPDSTDTDIDWFLSALYRRNTVNVCAWYIAADQSKSGIRK